MDFGSLIAQQPAIKIITEPSKIASQTAAPCCSLAALASFYLVRSWLGHSRVLDLNKQIATALIMTTAPAAQVYSFTEEILNQLHLRTQRLGEKSSYINCKDIFQIRQARQKAGI